MIYETLEEKKNEATEGKDNGGTYEMPIGEKEVSIMSGPKPTLESVKDHFK